MKLGLPLVGEAPAQVLCRPGFGGKYRWLVRSCPVLQRPHSAIGGNIDHRQIGVGFYQNASQSDFDHRTPIFVAFEGIERLIEQMTDDVAKVRAALP